MSLRGAYLSSYGTTAETATSRSRREQHEQPASKRHVLHKTSDRRVLHASTNYSAERAQAVKLNKNWSLSSSFLLGDRSRPLVVRTTSTVDLPTPIGKRTSSAKHLAHT